VPCFVTDEIVEEKLEKARTAHFTKSKKVKLGYIIVRSKA